MQPRYRSIIWRELPPFIRRAYVGWCRLLLHAELSLGEIYLTWTHSPSWNFVGIAGATGIVLTILLFLAPSEFQGETHSVAKASVKWKRDQSRRPWEIDGTLSVTSRSPSYPVELEYEVRSRSFSKAPVLVAEDDAPPHRRRRERVMNDPPLMPLFAPEPKLRAPVLDFDWEDDTPSETADVVRDDPPRFEVELQLLRRSRPQRKPNVPDVSFTARAESPLPDLLGRRNRNDPWQTFDPSRIAAHDHDYDANSQAVAVSLDRDQLSANWKPSPIPAAADNAVEIDLELSWDRSVRGASRRMSRAPQLQIRNLGPESIPRLDVIFGALSSTDFTIPQPLRAQTLPLLPPGQEHAVTRLAASTSQHSRRQIVSVLVTAFVGNETAAVPAIAETITETVTPRPARPPKAARQDKRPHLTLTIGRATRLRQHKMFSANMSVVNDGNVPLDGIVIVAEIPANLEHRYGRTVHFRIGALRPNEDRRTMLLLTPLEAGDAAVQLTVADAEQSAADTGVLELLVQADDIEEPPTAAAAPRRAGSRK